MKPGSLLHARVLDHVKRRLFDSERQMQRFHARWRANEMRYQAWLSLSDYDRLLKEANDSARPPKAVHITIPYGFSTLATISTYMLQVFCGRRPYLQVGTYGPWVENALRMEVVLQYQNDMQKFVNSLWRWTNDANLYGVGILTDKWRVKTGMRTQSTGQPVIDLLTGRLTMENFRQQVEVVEYEGNEFRNVDPFMFYPDPRVPMHEVAERGEYVFVRTFEGKHTLKRLEQQGLLKWVDAAPETYNQSARGEQLSSRALLSAGDPHAGGSWQWQYLASPGHYKVDQGSMEIIPRELGLGPSERVEKWLVTMLNDAQIVQLEPQLDDHGLHPVSVIEPYGSGYEFGAAGMMDYVAPIQDSMSWFLNAHMDNVRRVINDMIVYDPMIVEEKDLKRPGPGKLIRLKKTALNRDVRTAVSQLAVQDITRGHIDSMQTFFEIGQKVSAVSENLLGLQDAGGRKTATEVRTSFEAAASRLASLTRIVSSQGLTSWTRMMSMNTQQWMSRDFYTRVVGQDGMMYPLTITPDGLVGDFYYPIHDGTLPLDRVAMLDIWRQLFEGVLQDPQLRATYSVPKLFEFIAELGNAKNIRSFRLTQMDPGMIAQQAQQGNMVPLPQLQTSNSGLINAAPPSPGDRALQ